MIRKIKMNMLPYISMLILYLSVFINHATAKPKNKYREYIKKNKYSEITKNEYGETIKEKRRKNKITVKRKGEKTKEKKTKGFSVQDIRTSKWFDDIFDEIYIDEHNKLCITIIEDKDNMITYKPLDKPRKKVTHNASLDTVYHIKRKIVFNHKSIKDPIEFEAKLKKKSKRKWKLIKISELYHKNKYRDVFYFNEEGKFISFSSHIKCLDCKKGEVGGVR